MLQLPSIAKAFYPQTATQATLQKEQPGAEKTYNKAIGHTLCIDVDIHVLGYLFAAFHFTHLPHHSRSVKHRGGEASYSLLEGKRHMHPYIRLLLLTSCFGASSFYETSLDLSLCSLKAFKLDKQHTKPPKQHRQTKAYFSNIFQSQPQSF